MHVLLSDIAQSFGLLLFVFAFVLILIYAFSPSNKETFDAAASTPLRDEEDRHE